MASPRAPPPTNDCYSNPAFCMQSERWRRASSPRQSPVGANDRQPYEEQGFYEEVLVDERGMVRGKKLVVVRDGHRYEEIPGDEGEGAAAVAARGARYEHLSGKARAGASPPGEALKEGYALVRRNDRYEMLPLEKISDTYRYQTNQRNHRYEYIESPPRRTNPIATQKLYELLSTPRKPPSSTPKKLTTSTPKRPSSTGSPPRDCFVPPRAQQRLNYALATHHIAQDKRHTAIIAPICSSPVHSNRSESWMNLSASKAPVQATLAVAAIMMALCGAVTSGLCFYMVWIMGRLYYLDFGIVAGFTCLLLGLLGFRSRNCRWLPNRNYISGYIVLSVFSLLTCAGLLVLLFHQPKPGTPLADMTSGAVCGISVLSLTLASLGVVSSYCCRYPPPDNRVEHCARGFTV